MKIMLTRVELEDLLTQHFNEQPGRVVKSVKLTPSGAYVLEVVLEEPELEAKKVEVQGEPEAGSDR